MHHTTPRTAPVTSPSPHTTMSDALIEGVAGSIGSVVALVSTYPLLTVSTLRALDLKEGEDGQLALQGRLRLLPGPVQDVILFCKVRVCLGGKQSRGTQRARLWRQAGGRGSAGAARLEEEGGKGSRHP